MGKYTNAVGVLRAVRKRRPQTGQEKRSERRYLKFKN